MQDDDAKIPPIPTRAEGRRWHDMGGEDAGPVELCEHDYALWEKRVDALMVICSSKGHFTVDGLRRALEDMGEEAFETMSYYERWVAAINQNLVEAGVYTLEELGRRMEEVRARGATYGEAAAPQEAAGDG
jgi:hypothetical protein